MRARVVTPAGERDLETPLLGRGNLANVLAATAVALDFGVPLDVIADRDAAAPPGGSPRRGLAPPGRHHAHRRFVQLEPGGAARARSTSSRTSRGATRKVAVLGEMLELGDHALPLHDECGRAAAAAGLSALFAIGGAPARALADAAIGAGMSA